MQQLESDAGRSPGAGDRLSSADDGSVACSKARRRRVMAWFVFRPSRLHPHRDHEL